MTQCKTELTTQYVRRVETLPEAWKFVMDKIDYVGDSPNVIISPVWLPSDDPECHDRHFDVVVRGMVTVED